MKYWKIKNYYVSDQRKHKRELFSCSGHQNHRIWPKSHWNSLQHCHSSNSIHLVQRSSWSLTLRKPHNTKITFFLLFFHKKQMQRVHEKHSPKMLSTQHWILQGFHVGISHFPPQETREELLDQFLVFSFRFCKSRIAPYVANREVS